MGYVLNFLNIVNPAGQCLGVSVCMDFGVCCLLYTVNKHLGIRKIYTQRFKHSYKIQVIVENYYCFILSIYSLSGSVG